jgi:hypothetical protein
VDSDPVGALPLVLILVFEAELELSPECAPARGGKYEGSVKLLSNGFLPVPKPPTLASTAGIAAGSVPITSLSFSLSFLLRPKTVLNFEESVVPELLAEGGVCIGIVDGGESEDRYAISDGEGEGECESRCEGVSDWGVASRDIFSIVSCRSRISMNC